MNDQNREDLDAYYRDAASWNSDRLDALRSSNKVAWRVAAAACAVAVLEAGALLLLTPLKRVEAYTVLVDRTTGYVQAINPLDPPKISPDTALTQSFLVQYVIARESFDMATLAASYRKVALQSSGKARSNYIAGMQASNPQSPLVRYPRHAIVEARVKSVSPSGNDTATVRFDTVRINRGGQTEPPMSWVATIRYRFSGEPMKLEDRFVNPLGFQVASYRRDPEVAPQPLPITVTTAPSGPSALIPASPVPANGITSSAGTPQDDLR